MLKRLRSAIYGAPDLPKLRAFYAALLDQPPYFDQPFYVGFEVDGCELGLDPNKAPVGQPSSYWRVAELDAAMTRAETLGATRDGEPRDVGGGITMVLLRDPCGNPLGLIAESDG